MTEEIKFSVLVSLFNWIQKSKTSSQKRSKFRKFLDTYCKPSDYFVAVRLIIPSLDRERGSYGLKESVLATCLIDALGISRDAPDAVRLLNWRKGGTAKAGANAGNFSLIAAEVLQRRQGMASGGLTVKELNDLLDRLASSENRAEKTLVLSTLIQKTNAQEMKWVIRIILKDLKLGMSEKSIFQEFHPDAEDLFNVTCDLKLVCEKLRDRHQRHKRQDIEVGKAVRPQLAMRISDVNAAWKKLHGKDVVAECKFDGDRIQIHKNGTDIHYFSRNFLDHSEYAHAMSDLIVQNILVDKCILDGEMLVWDTSLNRFAEFGSNQEIAKAAREGLDSHKQLCYVAFDVLYVGDTSVIHQSLKERHELLRKVVKPLKGRLEVLVPEGGLNVHRPSGSIVVHAAADVERFFKETVENRDEGVVLKDLGSKWEPGDRSGKWLKLKPEYIRAGTDLDVLIIGGYYGSGRRGGEVAQFLVALADRAEANVYPRRFMSFCRVGTGLSDDELNTVVSKLKPYFRKNEHPKKAPPSFYQVTNHSKERPDVWIESPEKSIILSITSDIRTIRSEVFVAPYSLRFPRIDKVRYDKSWHECLDVQAFVELVNSSNGTTQKQKESESTQDNPKVNKSSKKGEKKNVSLVPSQFIQTDVSDIKGKTSVFSNMIFYFVNVPLSHSLETFHKTVVENGGKFSMNLNNSVTHCIAAESSGIKYQAAKRQRDVIHFSWVLDCCSRNKMLPLQPKYFLHLTDASRTKLQDDIDEFSDSYYWDLDLEGLKQVLSNAKQSEDSKSIDYYKKKLCPEKRWSCLFSCCVYFYPYSQTLSTEEEALLGIMAKRLALEVLMGGGKVSNNLAHASHLVVLTMAEKSLDFASVSKSFSEMEKRLLLKKRLHVVSSRWLEDSLQREEKLCEDVYNLRPKYMEESDTEESDKSEHDTTEVASEGSAQTEEPSSSKMTITSSRGRSTTRAVKRGRSSTNSLQRVQRRRGKQPSKITGDETEESDAAEEKVSTRLSDIAEETDSFGEAQRNSSRGRSAKRGKSRVGQTQRVQRSRRGKKPSKIGGDESEENDEFGDKNNVSSDAQESNAAGRSVENEETREPDIAKYTESLQRDNTAAVEDASQDSKNAKTEMDMKEKLKIHEDPLQAMLMNMFPSLSQKNTETSNRITGENRKANVSGECESSEKRKLDAETDSTCVNAGTDSEAVPPLVKKKKVSYRDVAGELLKDW
ncbi:DNA ligase 4 isoform X2 [Arabidopsis lyrata subsp. lyrata]|uniref:DNA ligase 4 isoform X2 n=1 Tax=Arabidopsis lyrata subsp. lyrata TaxID=81972 RepID=UPI000A29B7CB|nr:DNA ligase 4 isoform X2 [Arabidopsis lyrata subsp. lyrata]|eukprot:XP_020879936.1 DNA ligase 4 isoform X2 [Arabidopsis lyrata subsp. lyrata]